AQTAYQYNQYTERRTARARPPSDRLDLRSQPGGDESQFHFRQEKRDERRHHHRCPAENAARRKHTARGGEQPAGRVQSRCARSVEAGRPNGEGKLRAAKISRGRKTVPGNPDEESEQSLLAFKSRRRLFSHRPIQSRG